MRLKNKVALVTGGSRGIGAAICLGYAREGASVLVNYHSKQDMAEQVVAGIHAEGGQAVAIRGDVARAAIALFREYLHRHDPGGRRQTRASFPVVG